MFLTASKLSEYVKVGNPKYINNKSLGKCNNCHGEVFVTRKDDGFEVTGSSLPPEWIPYTCPTCGRIKFPVKAIRDIVFLMPYPPKPTVKGSEIIIMPEEYQTAEEEDRGVVLSCGRGFWDARKFNPVPEELKAGTHVMFDRMTPWGARIKDANGKHHSVRIMGYKDVKAIITKA